LFKFKFEKAIQGQHFEGLDLLTKLLTPIPAPNPARVLIEEISDPTATSQDSDSDSESEIQWYVEQQIQEKPLQTDLTRSGPKYGFAHQKCNIFSKLSDEYSIVIDLPNPDVTPQTDRTEMRIEDEKIKFNEDHYLADLYDDSETIESCLLKYTPCYGDRQSDEDTLEDDYTEAEVDCLKNLPKKTFLLSKQEKSFVYCGLIVILYAYCFNRRINCG
jgi:protein SHQ1